MTPTRRSILYALFFICFCITKTLYKRKSFSLLFNCSHTSKLYVLIDFFCLSKTGTKQLDDFEDGRRGGEEIEGKPADS